MLFLQTNTHAKPPTLSVIVPVYNDGRLYDISNDVLEENPVLDGGSQARKKLQAALDSMPSEGMKIYRPASSSFRDEPV